MRPEFEKLAELTVKLTIDLSGGSRDEAKSLLTDIPEDCPASAIYAAVRALYGINIQDWEPETFWLTLGEDGIDLDNDARNKLEAALTLQSNLAFYWDNLVFQNTVQALNGMPFNPECIQEPSVYHMAWAVVEAAVIRGQDPYGDDVPDFDDDVQMFVATVLKRAGWAIAPEELDFSQGVLDTILSSDAKNLQRETRDAWKQLDKTILQNTEFPEDRLGVQLSKLASCRLFLEEQAKVLGLTVIKLRGV